MPALKKLGTAVAGGALAVGTGLIVSFEQTVKASGTDPDRILHAPHFKWSHSGKTEALDSRSLRRGYEVYKKVCASCHGCFTVNFRMMANVLMTMEEAKAEAKRATYIDGPDDNGEMFERSGTLVDYLPEPYPNKAAAAAANGGKAPPDLGLIVDAKGEHGGENYIFSLLTGYCEAPAGYKVDDGLHFNPYFQGGAIAMPPPLYNEVIEFADGTPATKSQCAKDVATFLKWTSQPWHDDNKKSGLKYIPILFMCTAMMLFLTRRANLSAYSSKYAYTKSLKVKPQ